MKGMDLLSVLLTVLFVLLKLTGVITWSWVWVLAPTWIWWPVIAIALIIEIIMVIRGKI